MPFIGRDTLEDMQQSNQSMAAELSRIQGMGPILALAGELQAEIMQVLDQHPEFSASKIGEIAFRAALEEGVDDARDELVAAYQQAHRRDLYERVFREVETVEGQDISEEVRLRVETDPELALELRDSARKELAARALNVVRGEITQEQEAVIAGEAERQIVLDRLDVELARTGRLDLRSKPFDTLLLPGDSLDLIVDDRSGSHRTIRFDWTRDAYEKTGWVYKSSHPDIVWDRSSRDLRRDLFAHLGTASRDLTNGDKVVLQDTLEIGKTPVVVRIDDRGRRKTVSPTRETYDGSVHPVLLGTDFRTKDLLFFGATTSA